ncbi:hypothetical protein FNV43_RR07355 [Rhamnella rubrinervis]|uniref:Retrotransposon gag domain-containing protein n=1 Tax=Rhamnella rubrinervis TaxID=2594499 RepID=A0A8K0HGC7_9ROSA|nr:hypothetical protein FNV43_RR07355 [Rhamnella rubrinervis]
MVAPHILSLSPPYYDDNLILLLSIFDWLGILHVISVYFCAQLTFSQKSTLVKVNFDHSQLRLKSTHGLLTVRPRKRKEEEGWPFPATGRRFLGCILKGFSGVLLIQVEIPHAPEVVTIEENTKEEEDPEEEYGERLVVILMPRGRPRANDTNENNTANMGSSTNLLVAEDWIRDLEKIFTQMECTESQKVELFLKRYFPIVKRDEKEAEFLRLIQGNLSLVEYEQKFDELSHYAPHLVDTEERKARRR